MARWRAVKRWAAAWLGQSLALAAPPPLAQLESMIERLPRAGRLRVLEAGCGSLPIQIGLPADAHLVGIDTSQRQLDRNAQIQDKVLGDICTHVFDEPFDVVSCWDVLEHLPRPELALANLVRATRPGGLIVLKVPNVMSLKGLATKLTPHRFHVWVYRRVYGYEHAGQADQGPFRTYLRRSISERGLLRFARENGLVVELAARYESDHQARLRRRLRLDGAVWGALARFVRVTSFGQLELDGTELVVLLRK
jgi:SAM-dependent methyltransferase